MCSYLVCWWTNPNPMWFMFLMGSEYAEIALNGHYMNTQLRRCRLSQTLSNVDYILWGDLYYIRTEPGFFPENRKEVMSKHI